MEEWQTVQAVGQETVECWMVRAIVAPHEAVAQLIQAEGESMKTAMIEYYPQEVEYIGNNAPVFVNFLKGRQLAFWRDIRNFSITP